MKWSAVGFGAGGADVEPSETYVDYDEASLGVPPRGVYRMSLRRLKADKTGENSKNPGTPKFVAVLNIAEPKGSAKHKYNGYTMWLHRSVTEENQAQTNQFLMVLMDGTNLTVAKKKAVLKAFHTGNVILDDDGFIKKIGTWIVPEEIEVAANTRPDNYGGESRLAIASLIPISDAPKAKPARPEDEDEEDDDEGDEEDEDESDEEGDEEEEDGEEGGSDEADARFDELMDPEGEWDRKALVALYKKLTGDNATKAKSNEDLANGIVDAEFPEGEESEEDEEEEGDDEESEDEEEPDEEEEEEPPAKPAARRGGRQTAAKKAPAKTAAKPAPSGRGKATAGAGARPAARRRGAGSGRAPF